MWTKGVEFFNQKRLGSVGECLHGQREQIGMRGCVWWITDEPLGKGRKLFSGSEGIPSGYVGIANRVRANGDW